MDIINESQTEYSEILMAVKAIKNAIVESRYQIARLVNKESLTLYYNIGRYISSHSRKNYWGKGAIKSISDLLRQQLPGLRGFSETSLKDMRIFYEEWHGMFSNDYEGEIDGYIVNRQLVTADLTESQLEKFFCLSFTHHREILRKTNALQERLFYIDKCADEFWQVPKLKNYLKEGLFQSKKIASSNFDRALSKDTLRLKALESFKDNYVFDFVDLEDDEIVDEKILESEIIKNIKNFIMAFGQDFAFMGNQYRLTVDEEELFIDLLFYHRGLRCLVAVELKRGKFKSYYAGQLNTYLSALDDLVRRPDENPSIGLILCKEKSDKIVEYAFRDMSKPMGVATYTLTSQLPKEYRDTLPNPNDLRKLLDS